MNHAVHSPDDISSGKPQVDPIIIGITLSKILVDPKINQDVDSPC